MFENLKEPYNEVNIVNTIAERIGRYSDSAFEMVIKNVNYQFSPSVSIIVGMMQLYDFKFEEFKDYLLNNKH